MRKPSILCPLGLALAGALFSAFPARAAIVIDSFSDTNAAWPATSSNSIPQSRTENNLSGMAVPLGHRETTVGSSSGGVPGVDEVRASIITTAPGFLDYASTIGNAGTFHYLVGNGSTHPMNLDLTGQTRIVLSFLNYDLPAGQPIVISAFLQTSAGGWTLPPVSVTSAGPQDVSISLAGVAPSRLADVDGIDLTFNAPAAADFRIDAITAVPEPTTLSLLAGAAALLLHRARRRA